MNDKLIRLRQRRERLIAQIAMQRLTLAQTVASMRTPIALADRGLAVLRFIKRHPVLLAGAGMLLGALRPSRVGKWLRGGWLAWQFMRKLRRR